MGTRTVLIPSNRGNVSEKIMTPRPYKNRLVLIPSNRGNVSESIQGVVDDYLIIVLIPSNRGNVSELTGLFLFLIGKVKS